MIKLGRLLLGIRARLVGGPSPGKLDQIRQAVDRDGRWEERVEWRISTVTSTLIERTGERGYRKYHVRVECDYVFEAHCPTLARACEVAHIYEYLVPRLWQEFGWPSWASRSKLDADSDAV